MNKSSSSSTGTSFGRRRASLRDGFPATRQTSSTNVRRPMRRTKSDSAGGLKHLVDYSTKRASYNTVSDSNRSSCRGPVMSRMVYEGTVEKSISGRSLDWKVLSSSMDLSNDGPGTVRKNEENEKDHQSSSLPKRPEMVQRNCSAKLRVKMTRGSSCGRPNPVGEREKDLSAGDHPINLLFVGSQEEEETVPCPRIFRRKSLGVSPHRTVFTFRRQPATAASAESPAA